jgi:hypothetical protein
MVDVLTLDDLDTITAQELQARARTTYLANLELGYTMTGAELGVKFKRSARWGRLRIAEATASEEPSPALPDTQPALPPFWTPPAPEPETSIPESSLPPVVTPPAEPEPATVTAVPERHEVSPAVVSVPVNAVSRLRVWPVWLLMAPAAVAIWGGWVGLGELAGFGPVRLLPGIADQIVINTAITLPIGMEVYAAYALYVWLSGKARGRARKMAHLSDCRAHRRRCRTDCLPRDGRRRCRSRAVVDHRWSRVPAGGSARHGRGTRPHGPRRNRVVAASTDL